MINPRLLTSNDINKDARDRAKLYLEKCHTPVGAYSANSKGDPHLRQLVCDFIHKRDGIRTDIDNIYLTNGASEGVRVALQLLIRDENDGILIPIPQYPLYSALLTLMGGSEVPYYLNEEKNWSLNMGELKETIEKTKGTGKKIRSIVIINPGNPTGAVLSKENIRDVIKVCYENDILIMADEVYQENVYSDKVEFHSFRKVLHEMGGPYDENVELLSCHSVSKGILGECGFRGGYVETHNIDPFANEMIYKLKSIELCSNSIGQAMVGLMVDPPTKGKESDSTVEQYLEEKNYIFNGLIERAQLLQDSFNEMTGVQCQEIQGAMYAFPKLILPKKAIEAAKAQGVQPDFLYCMKLVNETGIMTVPGSGFGQVEGTNHFRITNLISPTEKMKETLQLFKDFNEKFHKEFQ